MEPYNNASKNTNYLNNQANPLLNLSEFIQYKT